MKTILKTAAGISILGMVILGIKALWNKYQENQWS